jgi:Fur family peroxide stress response transcriptional regulator
MLDKKNTEFRVSIVGIPMDREQIVAFLKEQGYRVTPQRIAICEEVLSSKDHPSAEQIHRKISEQFPTISLTTVYNTLDMLKHLNLVDELGFDSSKARYDPNTSIHVNTICQICHRIQDFESAKIKKNWLRIVSEIGLDPVGQRLDIYFICEKCRRKMSSSKK